MNNNITNVVLAGVGGQGILLASEIVARAAMAAGYEVKTNEVHGMAQRGGSVIAQIRFGPEVHGPLIEAGTAQVLASLECIEALRHADYLAPDGLAVVSRHEVVPVSVSSGSANYPENAEERLKKTFPRLLFLDAVQICTAISSFRASNTVIVGALSTGIQLPTEVWHRAIRECVKEKFIPLNIKAFDAGVAAARA